MTWILIAAALVPVIALFIYIWLKDKRQPEPLKWLFKALIYGVLSAVIVVGVLSPVPKIEITGWLSAIWNAFFMAAIPEESAKLLMLWLLLRKNPYFDEQLDGIVYATCIGLGFAGIENIGYVVSSYLADGNWLSISITRAIFSVPGHFSFAIVMGFYYALAAFGSRERRRYNLWMAWLIPVLLHGIYDSVLMVMGTQSPSIAAILFVAFVYFFIYLRKFSTRLIGEQQARDRQAERERQAETPEPTDEV